MRRLYARDHLDQVLATFGLILFFNEGPTILFGRQPLFVRLPQRFRLRSRSSGRALSGLPADASSRAGLLVAGGLYILINRTRLGMLVRAGATHREMVRALGVDIRLLYTLVFGLGALLAGLAGLMAGPLIVRSGRHGRAAS